MSEFSPDEQAEAGSDAIAAYRERLGLDEDDVESGVIDTIAAVLHHAGEMGLTDFDALCRMAAMHVERDLG